MSLCFVFKSEIAKSDVDEVGAVIHCLIVGTYLDS